MQVNSGSVGHVEVHFSRSTEHKLLVTNWKTQQNSTLTLCPISTPNSENRIFPTRINYKVDKFFLRISPAILNILDSILFFIESIGFSKIKI